MPALVQAVNTKELTVESAGLCESARQPPSAARPGLLHRDSATVEWMHEGRIVRRLSRGRRYLFCTTTLNWDMAKAACEVSTGWWLTEINSMDEDTCVDGKIPDGTNTWIGLRQMDGQTAVDTNWVWSHSGTAIPPTGTAFRRWESDVGTGSAPNDAGGASGEDGSQQCASTSGDNSGWDDRECVQTIPYVCEQFP
jgi:hypothetical protein